VQNAHSFCVRSNSKIIIPSETSDRRKAGILGGFHETIIPADRFIGPAGDVGICSRHVANLGEIRVASVVLGHFAAH